MADSINALNGQGMSMQFEKFAQLAASASKGSSAVRFLGHDSAATVRDVVATTSDKVGKIGRSVSVKEANNTTRAIFRQSVAAMFGGQKYVSKSTVEAGDPHNEAIADALEKFCISKVHPRQANAVFFALAQGGLSPQIELVSMGYKGGDHGPLTVALTKDENTGDITIKYSNPEGSPVKFGWTAVVDVDGKVATTPVKVGE